VGYADHIAKAGPLTTDPDVNAHWWTVFDSSDLNALIAEADAHSPTLAAASARLRQSEAARRAGSALFLPTVSGDVGAARQLSTPLRLGGGGPGNLFSLYTLSGALSYSLDLWGGQRRSVEALSASVDVEREAAHAARLTLLTTVSDTSIALSAYHNQLADQGDILDGLQALVTICQAEVTAGTAPLSNLLSLQAQESAAEIAIAGLQRDTAQADHLLRSLLGRESDTGPLTTGALETYRTPDSLPLSLPSQLIRQRPDIRAAEARLHGASAGIGIATADFFPALTITGVFGHSADAWPPISAAEGRFWNAGADVSVPLFAGGRHWYGRKAAIEAYNAALGDYRETVLAALADVSNTLSALDEDNRALAAATAAYQALSTANELAMAGNQAGFVTASAKINALIVAKSARSTLTAARARLLQDVVALYMALGGGWWNESPTTIP
jgi:NodT family efflux transporter outer membrane factor (OMF) lipoprotein